MQKTRKKGMKIGFNKNKKQVILNSIIFLILFLTSIFVHSYNFIDHSKEEQKILNTDEVSLFTQSPSNDTTVPVITFIQPSINNTVIKQKSYTIIVNISDENPPSYGNVTIQISNYSNVMFITKMNNTESALWSFNWDNISLYPNQYYTVYIIQIWAKDSSSNGNIGTFEDFYIYLNIPVQPSGMITVIISLILVCLLISGIMVCLERRLVRKASD
ncbi:MAG: hypothetical protein ACFE91_15940 [Promethearchaeota archaeon]